MTQENHQLVYESFDNREMAEKAFKMALDLGYKHEDISILMSEDSKNNYYATEEKPEEEAAKNLAAGGVLGGTIGGTIGAVIALGTNFALPGLGLVMVGPLVGAGGVYGGLLGSLIGWGSLDDEKLPNANDLPNNYDLSNDYKARLKSGAIILIVDEQSDKESVSEAWRTLKLN